MYLFFLFGLGYLFYQVDNLHAYPYFIVVTFILLISLGLFFTFLRYFSKEWFFRMMVMNISFVIFIPIIEGWKWLPFTVLYCVILAFLFIGYSFFQQRNKDY